MKNTVRLIGIRDYIVYAMGDFDCNMSFVLGSNYMMLFFTRYICGSLAE